MDDRAMIVAEAAFGQGVALDYDRCEAIARALGDRVMEVDALTDAIKLVARDDPHVLTA